MNDDDDYLKAQANAMLEAHLGHNPQLLAAAKAHMEEQIAASPETFLRRSMDNRPEAKIKKCRTNEASRHQFNAVTKVLDDGPIQELLLLLKARNSTSCCFPAVDVAAGSAYFTSQWSLRYNREPFCDYYGSLLEWYPTDTKDAIEQFTRPCLTYLVQEAAAAAADRRGSSSLLCTDRNGRAVFREERVILEGLKAVTFNGQEGVVLHKDPKIEGRFAVRLASNEKPMSVKAENLVVVRNGDDGGPAVGNDDDDDDTCTTNKSVEEQHQRLLSSQNFLERDIVLGLLERSCELDVLKRETWTNLKLDGQCALVTCTNLLTEIGHREPTAWKTVMELASTLLFPGGFFLHGDADGWGQFGNVQCMQEHATSLGFTLHSQIHLNAWALVLWEKG